MPDVELHAANLVNPSHMEWTFDGRLLVSQPTNGSIIDITDGGDMSHATPWVTGLDGPASILPRENGEILVAEIMKSSSWNENRVVSSRSEPSRPSTYVGLCTVNLCSSCIENVS